MKTIVQSIPRRWGDERGLGLGHESGEKKLVKFRVGLCCFFLKVGDLDIFLVYEKEFKERNRN